MVVVSICRYDARSLLSLLAVCCLSLLPASDVLCSSSSPSLSPPSALLSCSPRSRCGAVRCGVLCCAELRIPLSVLSVGVGRWPAISNSGQLRRNCRPSKGAEANGVPPPLPVLSFACLLLFPSIRLPIHLSNCLSIVLSIDISLYLSIYCAFAFSLF